MYRLQGKYAEAEPLLQEVIESLRIKGEVHLMSIYVSWLADVHRQQGKNTEARANYQSALAGIKKAFGEEHDCLGYCHKGLAQILLAEKKYVEAEAEIRTALAIFKKPLLGYQHQHFEATSILGTILAGQKKYDAAEPLLLQGYVGLTKQDKTAPEVRMSLLPQALDRLIQFYAETNKPDEVKKWQAEKEKLPKLPEPPKK